MHDDHALVETRIARFVAERLIPAVYRASGAGRRRAVAGAG